MKHLYSSYISSVRIVLRHLALLLCLCVMSSGAVAQCLSGWTYRVPVTVTNTSGSTLTSFQVKVTLNTAALITAGQMQSTGADIRFTDGSCNSLDYWIENQT